MVNQIQIFNNAQFGAIRATGTADNPLFCAMDLCKALGYSNGRDAVAKHVDSEDVAKRDTLTKSRTQLAGYLRQTTSIKRF